jgi:hypothetical protein
MNIGTTETWPSVALHAFILHFRIADIFVRRTLGSVNDTLLRAEKVAYLRLQPVELQERQRVMLKDLQGSCWVIPHPGKIYEMWHETIRECNATCKTHSTRHEHVCCLYFE